MAIKHSLSNSNSIADKLDTLHLHQYHRIWQNAPLSQVSVLKRSYFRFPMIYKAIRKVLFLGILDQRSHKGLVLDVTDVFKSFPQRNYKMFLN